MHNIVLHRSSEESFAFIMDTLRTKEFKESKEVQELAKVVAAKRPFWFSLSDERLERAIHWSWVNGIALRTEYKSPYLHDLYLLHELAHISTMPYGYKDWLDFHRKMMINEFNASLISECFVYFWIKDLRANTFTHPIYVDRFLSVEYFSIENLFHYNYITDHLTKDRERVMTTPNPFDFLEQQIANYGEMNRSWARIWSDSWKVVDEHMQTVSGADEGHIEWILKYSSSKPGERGFTKNKIFFRHKAKEYKAVVQENYLKFGNYIF